MLISALGVSNSRSAGWCWQAATASERRMLSIKSKGTIVCGPGSATQFVADTPLVSLSAQGNAEFEGNVGPFPTVCAPTNLAFLVRIAAGRWIANGAVRSSP